MSLCFKDVEQYLFLMNFQILLQDVRRRFEDEQARRFQNQYVTSKILEHEWMNRHEYGLPEDIGNAPAQQTKVNIT